MRQHRLLGPLVLIFLVAVLTRLAMAALVPIVLDEAYYIEWSQALDGGYFDHPPLIAWVNITSWLSPSSPFFGRLGAMIVAALAFPFTVGLFRRAGITDRVALLTAVLIANLNAFALVGGVLTTPDTVLMTAWAAALHEGAAALDGNRRRWLTAGLATGLGLLGKYTMVLVGPVYLWGLIRGDARALRTIWPYAGGCVALLVFSPHLVWNAQNEWAPIRMQLTHGFTGSHDPGFTLSTDLPAPRQPKPGGPEIEVGKFFGASLPESVDAADVQSDDDRITWWDGLRRMAEFLGGTLLMLGVFAITVIHWFLLRIRGRLPAETALNPRVKPLLVAATWFPIAFFALSSLKSTMQANWAAMFVVGAAGLLAGFGTSRFRDVVIQSAVNVVICLGLALYAFNPIVVPKFAERIMHETAGWKELANYVAGLDDILLTSREQPTAMIRFYQPHMRVAQWPGLAQPSEFVRRSEWNYFTTESLRQRGSFWVMNCSVLPPELDGFEPIQMIELRYCTHKGLVELKASAQPYCAPCSAAETIHQWYLVQYRATR